MVIYVRVLNILKKVLPEAGKFLDAKSNFDIIFFAMVSRNALFFFNKMVLS